MLLQKRVFGQLFDTYWVNMGIMLGNDNIPYHNAILPML